MRLFCTALLAATVLFGAGCGSLAGFRVGLSDFGSADLDGLVVYRQDQGGSYQPSGRITFQGTEIGKASEEVLRYRVDSIDPGFEFTTRVLRNAQDPDSVTLDLFFDTQHQPGTFKVASFSGETESELSAGSMDR